MFRVLRLRLLTTIPTNATAEKVRDKGYVDTDGRRPEGYDKGGLVRRLEGIMRRDRVLTLLRKTLRW